MSILIRPPGQPLAALDKRASDARYYQLDCSLLLSQFELLVAVVSVQGDSVDLERCKIGVNNTVSLYLKPVDCPATTPYIETPISIVCKTSQGDVQASLMLRVHKF